MDKETLSNYGWIVICVLVLAVMIALATPFGKFIKDAVWNTTNGLFDVNENALEAAGIITKTDINLNDWEYELDDENKVIKLNKYIGSSVHVNVPATFSINGKKYNSVVTSDVSKQKATFTGNANILSVSFEDGVTADGMSYMFSRCDNLRYVANYPSYDGEWWLGTFSSCYNLLSAPAIPNNIANIRIARFYYGCEKLIGEYSMPDSYHSTYYKEVFDGCLNINKTTNILWFGDSITAGTVTKGVSFVNYLREDLRDTAISNYAVGGHTLSYGYDQKEEDKMASIINDISKLSYNENIDYVFISAGTNDYAHNSSRKPFGTYRFADIGTVNDTTPSTVSGAINNIVESVAEKFPNAKLIFTTPLPRSNYDEEGTIAPDGTMRTVYLKDYADGMKTVFETKNIAYIDAYTEANLDKETDFADSTHPSLTGQEKLSQYYLNKLISIYGFVSNK